VEVEKKKQRGLKKRMKQIWRGPESGKRGRKGVFFNDIN